MRKSEYPSTVTECQRLIEEILDTTGIHPKFIASAITLGNPSDAQDGNKKIPHVLVLIYL